MPDSRTLDHHQSTWNIYSHSNCTKRTSAPNPGSPSCNDNDKLSNSTQICQQDKRTVISQPLKPPDLLNFSKCRLICLTHWITYRLKDYHLHHNQRSEMQSREQSDAQVENCDRGELLTYKSIEHGISKLIYKYMLFLKSHIRIDYTMSILY